MIFLFMLFFSIAMYQNIITYPTSNEYDMLSIAQQLEKGTSKELYVNWGVGYFAIWHGFDAKHYGSTPAIEEDYQNKIILTTKHDKKIENCEIIKKSKWLSLANC